jgi:hypothetical protein
MRLHFADPKAPTPNDTAEASPRPLCVARVAGGDRAGGSQSIDTWADCTSFA